MQQQNNRKRFDSSCHQRATSRLFCHQHTLFSSGHLIWVMKCLAVDRNLCVVDKVTIPSDKEISSARDLVRDGNYAQGTILLMGLLLLHPHRSRFLSTGGF